MCGGLVFGGRPNRTTTVHRVLCGPRGSTVALHSPEYWSIVQIPTVNNNNKNQTIEVDLAGVPLDPRTGDRGCS